MCCSVAILTLANHTRDVWITRIVEKLGQTNSPVTVQVVCVETYTVELATQEPFYDVVVNRVSDAAEPAQAKATLLFLLAAELRGCTVLNGSQAYTIGMNKALHHILLAKEGLQTPETVLIRSLPPLEEAVVRVPYPVLYKPNSGGFGAGIVRFESSGELLSAAEAGEIKLGQEGVALLQEYVEPSDGSVYRVWVCGGSVQCAVRVEGGGLHGNCMSTSCRRRGAVRAWDPPESVKQSVLRVMARCGAQLGSVELLYRRCPGSGQPQPLYFDVNMLSTLLDPSAVEDPQGLWPEGFDPWLEQAEFIASRLP
mmetsp:Transcript_21701/g.51873  ORF Transcript_21701/g.51873 Transcript_21701/m.51873 type:complete len:311 (-) Transcript_21701:79-1011(-)